MKRVYLTPSEFVAKIGLDAARAQVGMVKELHAKHPFKDLQDIESFGCNVDFIALEKYIAEVYTMAQKTVTLKSVWLMTSVSKHDNFTRYYIKFGDNPVRRTTKARYDYVKDKAVRLDSFLTKSNAKNTHWHHSVSAYLEWREYHYISGK